MPTKGFDKKYWDQNYSAPETMDCIGNAKEHVQYLKSLLLIENVAIGSIIDLGFGYGALFREALKVFKPARATGLEPSRFAFDRFRLNSLKAQLYCEDVLTWSRRQKSAQFDLGICTSVFQYIDDKSLKEILPVLSRRVKYLYLTVPTEVELKRQITEFKFKDPYAIHRSQKKYQKMLSPYFTFIGSRFLESKHFYNEKNTKFSDLLFRF